MELYLIALIVLLWKRVLPMSLNSSPTVESSKHHIAKTTTLPDNPKSKALSASYMTQTL